MKHPEDRCKTKEMGRRKFLIAGLATGALALGGVLEGNKDLQVQSMEQLGGPRCEISIDGK